MAEWWLPVALVLVAVPLGLAAGFPLGRRHARSAATAPDGAAAVALRTVATAAVAATVDGCAPST